MPIDIVIVNWNSGRHLSACLESIERFSSGLAGSVIVVDNASTTDPLIDLKRIKIPFEIIRNHDNVGFAAACAQGARASKNKYLLFLNPDAQLLRDSLRIPFEFMERPENARVGICGVQLLDEGECVARHCARFPTLSRFMARCVAIDRLPGLRGAGMHMTDWDHLTTREVDHVIGAFFFVRRTLFDEIGGFDTRFFLYLEDIDFSLRAHHAGWRSVFLAEAQALHVVGGGTTSQVRPARLFYALRSRIQYGFKHFTRTEAWLLTLMTVCIEPFSRLLSATARGKMAEIRHTLLGYGMLIKNLPNLVRDAEKVRANAETPWSK